MDSFSYLEPVCCSMSSSNCSFLTCIQISQEAGQVVRYSHLLKNFPEFVVVHIVQDFGIVNKAEVDVFLELSCFFDDPTDVGNLISGSSSFSVMVAKWSFAISSFLLQEIPLKGRIFPSSLFIYYQKELSYLFTLSSSLISIVTSVMYQVSIYSWVFWALPFV